MFCSTRPASSTGTSQNCFWLFTLIRRRFCFLWKILSALWLTPSPQHRHQNRYLLKFVSFYLVQILNGNLACFIFLQIWTYKGLFFKIVETLKPRIEPINFHCPILRTKPHRFPHSRRKAPLSYLVGASLWSLRSSPKWRRCFLTTNYSFLGKVLSPQMLVYTPLMHLNTHGRS